MRASMAAESVNIEEFDKVNNETNKNKIFWSQWVAALISSLILFVVGLGNGWSSPYLAKLSLHESVDGLPKATDEELSWVASLMNTGRIFGAAAGAVAQDIMGRKKTLHFSGIPMMAGWICITVAMSIQWLFAARVFIGFAMGMVWTTTTHYLAEIADPQIRGSLVVWNLATHSTGVFIGNLIGPYISMRVFAYICLFFNVSFLALFLFLPDTPYRYLMLGDVDKAEKSLQWFRRTTDVKEELLQLQDYISNSKSTLREVWTELKEPRYCKSFFVVLIFNLTLFFGAYNVTISYMEIILTMAKVSITPSTIVTTCGLFAVLSSLTAACLVDRFGRRKLLITSCIGMAISLTCLGIHFQLLNFGHDPIRLTWLPSVCLLSYIVSYSAGLGCVPNTLVGELFSPRLKSIASLCFTGIDAVQAALATGAFVPFLNLIGASFVFWFFACGIYGAAFYFYFNIPETMGKSLKDIQRKKSNAT